MVYFITIKKSESKASVMEVLFSGTTPTPQAHLNALNIVIFLLAGLLGGGLIMSSLIFVWRSIMITAEKDGQTKSLTWHGYAILTLYSGTPIAALPFIVHYTLSPESIICKPDGIMLSVFLVSCLLGGRVAIEIFRKRLSMPISKWVKPKRYKAKEVLS